MKSPVKGAALLIQHTSVKFAGVGVVNTLLTLAVIFSLKYFLSVPDASANLTGYLAGLASSFAMNRQWTFRHQEDMLPALGRFLVVFGASYALSIAVVLAVIRLGMNSYAAHVVGMPFYTIAFYFGCREFAFRSGKETAPARVVRHETTVAGAWYLATIVPFAVALLYRLGAAPLEIWDEARLANNAIEMASGGLSLITTYNGTPDHWNTKPPLLIWLMAISIRVFGPTEFAVRLPSVLAALATASLIFYFCAARLKRPFAGFAAALFMLTMPGYVLMHAARSGDYDALLTLWTTAYLLAGYMFFHDVPQRRSAWLYISTLAVASAFLTKTVQGLVLVPPLFIYALLTGRLKEVLRTRALYLGGLMIATILVGYYAVREYLDPGYSAAALGNDLVGRYASVIEGHSGGPAWYFTQLRLFPWLIPGLIAGLLLAYKGGHERASASVFIGLAAAFYLGVISSASTKLSWYLVPLCPLLALLLGLAADQGRVMMRRRFALYGGGALRLTLVVCLVASLGVVAFNLRKIDGHARWKSAEDLDRHSVFLRDVVAARPGHLRLVVMHPGYPNRHGDAFYIAPTLFYAKALQAAGHDITIEPPGSEIRADADTAVLCGKEAHEQISSVVPLYPIEVEGGCGLYKLAGIAGRRQ